MATGTLLQSVGSILSIALLTSGGGSSTQWQLGQSGYTIAQVQAELGVLGFNVGPVSGHVTRPMISGAAQYVTTFGMQQGATFDAQLAQTIQDMGTVPDGSHGALVLAVQDDLKILGLYHDSLNGQWSSALSTAIDQFQSRAGLSTTHTLTAQTLASLAHLTAVHVTAANHWSYRAQSGDSLRALAFAAGLPYQGFARANNQHGSSLWAGQRIAWKTARVKAHTAAPTSPSTTPGNASSTTGSPGSGVATGVLANLQPVSDLVVLNPTASEAESLAQAESSGHMTVDVSVTGQWALLHPQLIKSLSSLGNELAISGYTGKNLNLLPKWGVDQELTWSVHVLASEVGTSPTFVIGGAAPNATVRATADKLNLVAMSPSLVLRAGPSPSEAANQTASALLDHLNQVVAIQGPINWSRLFSVLTSHHFVFETLGQIWANQ